MRAAWEERTLGEVCEIKPPKGEARARVGDHGHVSFLPMEDLGSDRKYAIPSRERRLSDVIGSYTYFAEGDVLLAKITPCFENGKLGIARGLKGGVGFGSSEYVVMRPGTLLSNEWLYYYLARESFRAVGAARMTGACGHKRVPKEFIEGHPIPLPPIPEQQRIAAILDEAFEGIAAAKANAEKNVQNAQALLRDELEWVFSAVGDSWEEVQLGHVTRFIDYRGKTPNKTEAGLRLITAKNVRMGYLRDEPREFVAPETYDSWMTRGIPRAGDVLFTTEAPLANVAQLDTDAKVVFAQRIIIMQPDVRMDSTFLKYLLMAGPIQRRIHRHGTGATALGIKASLLKTIPVCFPNALAEQRQIVGRLDCLSIEAKLLESLYRRKLAELDALKASLLHQAFSGNL